MKWLLVLLVILAGVWWLRKMGRGGQPSSSRPPSAATDAAPQAMTQCRQCGLHLPRADAIQGQQGDYCSVAHRQLSEG